MSTQRMVVYVVQRVPPGCVVGLKGPKFSLKPLQLNFLPGVSRWPLNGWCGVVSPLKWALMLELRAFWAYKCLNPVCKICTSRCIISGPNWPLHTLKINILNSENGLWRLAVTIDDAGRADPACRSARPPLSGVASVPWP
jgi:hypothetical protein